MWLEGLPGGAVASSNILGGLAPALISVANSLQL